MGVRSLKWSTSHAVFVTEIDDEHKEIFAAVSNLQAAAAGPLTAAHTLADRLATCIVEHFAHEERLMHAARYSGLRWHREQHQNARRQVGQFVSRIEAGDAQAIPGLVDYLTAWLPNHARIADRMMGASLRNHDRVLWKLTFSAGTRPKDACAWVDADGNRFDPSRP